MHNARSVCHAGGRLDYLEPPTRQPYGSFLGIPVLAVRWLLQTESEQVVLIVGLMGFGLLGALVSGFANPSPTAVRHHPSELVIVVFVGFCAAIVVFVASYGGLAVTMNTEADPNAYVVFMACLVGAVFSKRIWEKARVTVTGGNREGA